MGYESFCCTVGHPWALFLRFMCWALKSWKYHWSLKEEESLAFLSPSSCWELVTGISGRMCEKIPVWEAEREPNTQTQSRLPTPNQDWPDNKHLWDLPRNHKMVSESVQLKCISLSIGEFPFFFFFFVFLGPHPQLMEVPRLGVESELQLPACPTATATWDLSCLFNLHDSSRQHRILNPGRETRGPTCVLMDTSQIHFRWARTGTPGEFL